MSKRENFFELVNKALGVLIFIVKICIGIGSLFLGTLMRFVLGYRR